MPIESTENTQQICPACMKIKGEVNICPHCNYDEQGYQASALHIKPRTVLHNRYVIGNAIGQGGFGITYIGKDTVLNKKVAIKEYLPTMLAARAPYETQENTRYTVVPWDNAQNRKDKLKEGLDSFLEEARRLAELDHENIVRVINFFEENNTAYIVMDYVGQENLSELLKRRGGTLPVQEALNILLPILDALKQIHAKQFFHRDVSAANIRMVDGKKPVLIDFGAAKYLTSEVSHSLEKVYKPGYSPIEQMAGSKKVGAWTDIYACGATFYLMLTGKLPPISIERFDRDELVQLTNFPELNIPQHINNATLYALAVRAEDRFATVEEFELALTNPEVSRVIPKQIYTDETAQLVEDIPVSTDNTSQHSTPQKITRNPTPEKPKKNKLPLLAVLLTSFFIVVAAIYLILFGIPDPNNFAVEGFDKPHVVGNKVNYEIAWKDKIIKSVIFKLQNTNIIKMHEISENMTSLQGKFDTNTLRAPQDYPYTITLIDNKGQSYELDGKLQLLEVDTIKPTGQITGFKDIYREGDSISFTIDITDNRQLEKVSFLVKDSIFGFEQILEQQTFNKSDSFSTSGWDVNKTYYYELKAIDSSKNIFTYPGQFYLQEVDRIAPTGEIANIYEEYDEGDYVHVQIKANDNKQLKAVEFKIQDTQIRKEWSVDEAIFSDEVPILTRGWETNRDYTYVLTVIDAENNKMPKTGSFYLKGVDNIPPTIHITSEPEYREDGSIVINLKLEDAEKLQSFILYLNDNILTKSDKIDSITFKKTFELPIKQLELDKIHTYEFIATDVSGNKSSKKGSFKLISRDKLVPVGKVTGIAETYHHGDTIYYQIEAQDNKQLSEVRFEVENTPIQQRWSVNQALFNRSGQFDTNSLIAGKTYTCALHLIDLEGLKSTFSQDFMIKAEKPVDEQKLAELEVECQKRFERWDFTTVDSDEGKAEGAGTALDCYNEMLALQPNNQVAIEGKKKMTQIYATWARNALSRAKNLKRKNYYSETAKDQLLKAENYINNIGKINVSASEIKELNRKVRQIKNMKRITGQKNSNSSQPTNKISNEPTKSITPSHCNETTKHDPTCN